MPRPSPRSILLLVHGADRFGTGTQALLAVTALVDAGWRVRVALAGGRGALGRALQDAGGDVVALSSRPRPGLALAAPLSRLLRAERPRGVVSMGRATSRVAAAALAVVPGPALVALLARSTLGLADRLAVSRAARVVAATPAVAAACRAAGVDPDRIDTVAPGSMLPGPRRRDRRELATRLGLDPGRCWTVAVAPLEPATHLTRLVWAIDQLGVVRRDLDHVLVGSGPLAPRLARRAHVQRITDRFVVVPWCGDADDLLAEAALVWQSGDVAYGGALVDGLAHGKPLVAVDSPAAREAIADGVNGRIVPARPESEFPRRAFQILEDAALESRYGMASRTRAATLFDPARAAAGYVAAVERAVGS